jgi:hypothetical protein
MNKKIFSKRFNKVIDKLNDCNNSIEYHAKLIELGFTYTREEGQDEDIIEEQAAIPYNENQKNLVNYFEGHTKLTHTLLTCFLEEKASAEPPYALIRRYFRAANKYLKALILLGLSQNPTDKDLLSDLTFFNEFKPDLRELIFHYKKACQVVTDWEIFKELVQDFKFATLNQHYQAYEALLQDNAISEVKKQFINQLDKKADQQLTKLEDIDFKFKKSHDMK